MDTHFIEVTNTGPGGKPFNWGKFMVGRFTVEEWQRPSYITTGPLLQRVGWADDHLFVVDLQTGEGSIFLPGGSAKADLEKHKVWVCPMFEPFLTWLYQQDLSDLAALPHGVTLNFDEAPPEMYGYRRPGPARGEEV